MSLSISRAACWAGPQIPPRMNHEGLSFRNRRHGARLTLGVEDLLVTLEILFGRHLTGPDFLDLFNQIGLTLWRPEGPRGVSVVAFGERAVHRRQYFSQSRVDTGQVLTFKIDGRWNYAAFHQEPRLRFRGVVVVEERRRLFWVLRVGVHRVRLADAKIKDGVASHRRERDPTPFALVAGRLAEEFVDILQEPGSLDLHRRFAGAEHRTDFGHGSGVVTVQPTGEPPVLLHLVEHFDGVDEIRIGPR